MSTEIVDSEIAINGESHHQMEVEEALPVRIVENPVAENKAADLGSLRTYTLAGTEAAFRILPQTGKRNRATLQVSALGGASPLTTDSTAPLGIGGVFTGAQFTVPPGVTQIVQQSIADQAGTLQLLVQNSAGAFVVLNSVATVANTAANLTTNVVAGMVVKVQYTNGGVAQTTFNLMHYFNGGAVLIGKFNQMSNAQGYVLYSGATIVIESAPEVWCLPLGTSVTLSVEDEQYK